MLGNCRKGFRLLAYIARASRYTPDVRRVPGGVAWAAVSPKARWRTDRIAGCGDDLL